MKTHSTLGRTVVKNRPVWVAFGVVLSAMTSYSQNGVAQNKGNNTEPDTTTAVHAVSLIEARQMAFRQNPLVQLNTARINAQRAQADIAGAYWYPSIGGTVQLFGATSNNWTGTYLGQRGVDIPRVGSTKAEYPGSLSPYASTFAALSVNQLLIDSGRIRSLDAVERAGVDVEIERQKQDTLWLSSSVDDAYFSVLASRAVHRAAREARQRAQAHRDAMRAMVQERIKAPFEITRAEADYARFDATLARATAQWRLSRMGLAGAVGVTEGTELDASEETVSIKEAELQRSLLGLAEHPRYRMATAMMRLEHLRTEAIDAETRPYLMATATLSGRAGGAPTSSGDVPFGAGFVPYVPNWDVGLVLTWPLYDASVGARKQASIAREQVRKEEADLVKYELELGVRQAYAAIEVAQSAIPSLERALDAAKANYSAIEARTQQQLATAVELADAEGLLLDAEIQLALGKLAVEKAKANLEHKSGQY